MINLIPPMTLQDQKYGRKNVVLLRWISVCIGGMICIILVAAAGYFYISQAEKATAERKSNIETEISEDNLSEELKLYEAFANKNKAVLQILGDQILFSDLVQSMGQVLPSGVVLKSMTLNETDNALSLDFSIPNQQTASILQANLEDPANELFDKADTINTSCTKTDQGEECSTQVRAQFSDNARFILYSKEPAKLEEGKK